MKRECKNVSILYPLHSWLFATIDAEKISKP